MMRILASIAITALCFLMPSASAAQDWSPLGGVVVTPSAAYDKQAGATAAGMDINIIVAGLNAGITFRHWDDDVAGWDGSAIPRDETTIYFGLGLVNMIQLQAGYSGSGASLRVRSDMALFNRKFPLLPSLYSECEGEAGDAKPCRRITVPRRSLVISPFVEFTPFKENHKTIYGLGMGMVF